MEARLEVRTVEERLRAIEGRADALTTAAAAERQASERAQAPAPAARRGARPWRGRSPAAPGAGAGQRRTLPRARPRPGGPRPRWPRRRGADELKARAGPGPGPRRRAGQGWSAPAHGAEIARAEHRLRWSRWRRTRSRSSASRPGRWSPSTAPSVPHPAARRARPRASCRPATTGPTRSAAPRRPSAQLARLGKVNPLALEEYAALQERHSFLATQLEDLKKTRRDLLTVVKEVDDRVQEVFASAYADTAREFEHIFSRLFPGGQGRLVLTEPDDMLATGIEVEARPPGKKVKRLSLLSGGERSLTADRVPGARSSRRGRRRSTCWTRSRRRWTTPTCSGCCASSRS